MNRALRRIANEQLSDRHWIDMCLRVDAIPALGLDKPQLIELLGHLGQCIHDRCEFQSKKANRWYRHLSMPPGPPPVKLEPKQNVSAGIQEPAKVKAEKKQRIDRFVQKAAPTSGNKSEQKDVLAEISNASKKTPIERKKLLTEVQTIVKDAGNLFTSRASGAPALTIDDMKELATSVLVNETLPMDELANTSGLGLPETSELNEGDMITEPGSKAALLQRGVMDTWPQNNVSYCFDAGIEPAAKAAFESAVKEFRDFVPCLSFEEVSVAAPNLCSGSGLAVYVTSSFSGCWSYVGPTRFTGKSQKLNLGPGCAFHGIAVHEIGHAVGMGHEHSRPDRDTYMKLHNDNIRDGMINQFTIEAKGSTVEDYAYDSVMHYGATAFGKYESLPDGSTTQLQTIEVLSGAQIGQRMGLAEYDIIQLMTMYGCPSKFQLPSVDKFEVAGICEEQNLNGVYYQRGKTKDGRDWFEHVSGGKFLYFDNDCDGQGSFPRWQLDGDQPSEAAEHDLDADGTCSYAGRLNVLDRMPPLGERMWTVYCNGWKEQLVSIQNVTDPNATVLTWRGSSDLYTIPELLETEPALRQENVAAEELTTMTLQFSTPVHPGQNLSTMRLPKELQKAAFADVVLEGTKVSLSFAKPLASGTRYTLEMAYGSLTTESKGKSPLMNTLAFTTALGAGQTNLSEGLIVWNQYGTWVEEAE